MHIGALLLVSIYVKTSGSQRNRAKQLMMMKNHKEKMTKAVNLAINITQSSWTLG